MTKVSANNPKKNISINRFTPFYISNADPCGRKATWRALWALHFKGAKV